MTTIILDPGHGGAGGGIALGRSQEKDFALSLARGVARILGPDLAVQLTRDRDVAVPASQRAESATRAGAQVFLSLHARARRGCEAWVHPRALGPSRDLALLVCRELAAETGVDLGVKAADLAVLRPALVGAGTAACLLEVEWSEDQPRVDRMTHAIARAIRRYLRATRDMLRLLLERGETDSEGGEPYAGPSRGAPRTRRYGGWASDDVSPNYRHLVGAAAGMSVEFDLSGATLQTLCEWNAFDVTPANEASVVLFGLRGCRLVDPSYDGSFAASVRISEDLPDHQVNHCVLGVWRPSTSEVAAMRGSTVPNLGSMRRFMRGGEACNMMLTGRYDYRVGGHRPAGDRLHLEGVFVQQGRILVIRSRRDDTYDTSDDFDWLVPGDNIHPSRFTDSEAFSSEGCSTVAGGGDTAGAQFEHRQPPGWVKFREAAGLEPRRARAAQNGRPYIYVLLTGREARLAANGADGAQMRRLRQGSSGAAVESLQRVLQQEPASRRYSGPIDGKFGGGVAHAWAQRQREIDGAWDGIVTPADAAALGFDIATGAQAQTDPGDQMAKTG